MPAESEEIGQVRLQGWFDSARWLWTVRVLVNGVQVGDLRMNDGQYEVLTAALSDRKGDGRG